MTHHTYIACARIHKPFFILAINGNNFLCCDIIVYKLNPFIDVVIL